MKILGDLLLIHSFYCVMMGSEPTQPDSVIGWHGSYSYQPTSNLQLPNLNEVDAKFFAVACSIGKNGAEIHLG